MNGNKKYSFFKFVHYYIRIILLCLILDFSFEYTIKHVDQYFPKLKQLPSGKYLVIMNKGIYIYNYNFTYEKTLLEFKSSEIIYSEDENNKTSLAEYNYNNTVYILYLVKTYLFLFDYQKTKIYKKNLKNYISGSFFNVIPYLLENNNLHFIIVSSKLKLERCDFASYYYLYYLIFYHFYIEIKSNDYSLKIKDSKEYKVNYGCNSYITSLIFNCQILASKNYLICLYLTENNKKIDITIFDINSNYKIIKDLIYSNKYINKIMQIKTSLSTSTNNLFIC